MFTLQTLPAEPETPRRDVAEASGFSLHAGIAAKSSQRDKLERLARYVSGPPVATERLSLTRGGRLRVIANIEQPAVIERILEHLGRDAASVDPAHPSRAPPKSDRLI